MSTPKATLEELLLAFQLPEEWTIKLKKGTLTASDLRQIYRLLKRNYLNHPMYQELMELLEEKHQELEGSLELDDAFEMARNDLEPDLER
ncbi:MAG: hypothetical protein VX730_04830 [Pseudomonadota bacterium]|nr:hypothetical protein [Pseudomonadota bacterium]